MFTLTDYSQLSPKDVISPTFPLIYTIDVSHILSYFSHQKVSERHSTHLSDNVYAVSHSLCRRQLFISPISGLLFTIMIFIILSLCCGFAHAATVANPVIREDLKEKDLLIKSLALEQLKQKFARALEEFGNDEFGGNQVNDTSNEGDSFKKLPRSLKQKLAKQQKGDRDGEEERKYVTLAKPGLYHWPGGGSRGGFYFDIPNSIPHESIESAEVIFDDVSPVSNYSLVFMSEQANETFTWSLKPFSKCQVNRPPQRTCASMKVQVGKDIEHMLFLSGNLHSTFQLRFFLVNPLTKETIDWKNISETPVLNLKFTIRTRKSRQIREIVHRECSSSPMEACCLVRSSVSLKELGWETKVSSPYTIEFNYCRGSCIGTQDHYTTYNAVMRQAIALRYGESMGRLKLQAFKACCAPYSYEPIVIWKKAAPGAWTRVILPDAKATACACL